MTLTLEAAAAAGTVAPVVATAAYAAADTGGVLGIVVAAAVTGCMVPLFRWLMKREDRRQAFQENQAETRDKLLSAQAEQLTQQTAILRQIADGLKTQSDRLAALEQRCRGGLPGTAPTPH